MASADDIPLDQLVKKRVAFQGGDEHARCWHARVGLRAGLVLRMVPTRAQKAELLAAEGITLPQRAALEEEVARVWVKADPCRAFPQGCEVAIEPGCLCVEEG